MKLISVHFWKNWLKISLETIDCESDTWHRTWHTSYVWHTIFFNRIAWWFMRVKKVKLHTKRVKINGDGPPRGVTVDKRVFRLGLLQNQTESLTNIICEALQPFILFQPKSKPVVGLWSPTVYRSWTLWPALARPPPIGSKVPQGSLPNLPLASLRAREPRRLWRRSSHHAVHQSSITRHKNRPKYPPLNRARTEVFRVLSWPFTSRGSQPCRPYCCLVRPGSVTVL